MSDTTYNQLTTSFFKVARSTRVSRESCQDQGETQRHDSGQWSMRTYPQTRSYSMPTLPIDIRTSLRQRLVPFNSNPPLLFEKFPRDILPGEAAYQCKTCGADDTCIQCMSCYKQSDHVGHETIMRHSGGGCCGTFNVINMYNYFGGKCARNNFSLLVVRHMLCTYFP